MDPAYCVFDTVAGPTCYVRIWSNVTASSQSVSPKKVATKSNESRDRRRLHNIIPRKNASNTRVNDVPVRQDPDLPRAHWNMLH